MVNPPKLKNRHHPSPLPRHPPPHPHMLAPLVPKYELGSPGRSAPKASTRGQRHCSALKRPIGHT